MTWGSTPQGRCPEEAEDRLGGRRRGISLIEALVVLVLLSLVVQMGWTVLGAQRRAASSLALRAEGLETVRTVGWLLSQELAGGEPGGDWWASEDSIGLRAFRGLGVVLGGSGLPDRLRVCYRGIRNPAPEKDSVLLLGTDGRWRAHDLVRRTRLSGGCAQVPESSEEEWVLSPEPRSSVLARAFERGSYHLSSGALRYRRGGGGRQPLTPERIQACRIITPPAPGGSVGWEILLGGVNPGKPGGAWMGVAW